jgi:phytoene dehydrogenase-like protein
MPTRHFDAVVIGGGHNGLVAAAYLGRAGLSVLLLEARDRLGGPCGSFDFLPGYRTAFSNSPGSLEATIVEELDLASFGLRFVRTDPTVIHPFPSGAFVGWRDRERVSGQFERFAPGEAARYHALMGSLEDLATRLGISIFEAPPGLDAIEGRLKSDADKALFRRVFRGSLAELLHESLRSDEAKALLAIIALNTNLATPSMPGTAVGLMLRPFSLVSSPDPVGGDDARRLPLRGSTGLPVGGMGAIVDALAACCRKYGVVIRTGTRATQVRPLDDSLLAVSASSGDEFRASTVISAINPRVAFRDLLDDQSMDPALRVAVARQPIHGSAFKLVLALDRLPHYAGLPPEVTAAEAARCQFRIAPSLAYIEAAGRDGIEGRYSSGPLMWGLIPSATSPELAPPGKHLLSVNIWHAPYRAPSDAVNLELERFADRSVELLAAYMPDLPEIILDRAIMGPAAIEAELGLVESNIAHGDMLPDLLFGQRPHALLNDYRTPLAGFYLTGGGTWPGGYVTCIPGRNASQTVLADMHRYPVKRKVSGR